MLPHIKETFSDAVIFVSENRKYAEVENLNHNFTLIIEDQKIHPDDSFGFVKLKAFIDNTHFNYEQMLQFITVMNHCHRGCHWAIDTLHPDGNKLYLYSTLITELGRRNDDREQMVMEILNLQKMKYLTDQYLIECKKNPFWFKDFLETYGCSIIPCHAPENYIPEPEFAMVQTLERILKLNYNVQKINNTSFKITSEKNSVSILTFLGHELVSVYSVVTEENKTSINLRQILNERNQDILWGHYEISPVQNIIGFTNYLRLSDGLRDIKLRLFLDSPDFARTMYFENQYLAA